MRDMIYITGHRNPDTDSICSAIAYAELKNKIGSIPAIPIRLGELNNETKFVLNFFNVESPLLVETVKTQVSDLNIDNTAPISPQISIKMAWSVMKKHRVKSIPVVDEDGILVGIVSPSHISATYMDIWDTNILGKSNTSLHNIMETLAGKLIYSETANQSFKGKIIVSAMNPDSTKELIEDGDIVICGDRVDSQLCALEKNITLLVITGNHNVDEEVLEKAQKIKCSIISTPYDTFSASRLITQSIPVSYVMAKSNLISFRTDDFIEDIKDVMIQTRYRSYPVVDDSGKVVGTISRYHLISQNQKKIILLDHNEKTQSVHGLEDAEILEIIDHHRVADVQTGHPIYFRNEPVGSTSTIIAMLFFENGIIPTRKTAGILCAAIISDTLYFKSPTTTNTDKITFNRLLNISGINPDKFAEDMFKAGTSLHGRTASQILNQDFKIFNISDVKIGISQISSVDMEGFKPLEEEIKSIMVKKLREEHFDLLILMLTDIVKGGSHMIIEGEQKELVYKTFNSKPDEEGAIFVPGVISRKKQVLPPLTTTINSNH